jgi:phosphotriesterase-related protein
MKSFRLACWALALTSLSVQVTGGTGEAAAVPGQVSTSIPNMEGSVLTVNGPIDPDTLGNTIMHEHIFINFSLPDNDPERWRWAGRTPPRGATAVGLYNRPLTMDILDLVTLGRPNRDNLLLTDEATAIDEVREFKIRGGQTIVDVTSIGLGRDPLALRRVAQASGLQIVMGASWYRKSWHPRDMDSRSVESLTEQIVHDVVSGVDDTGIRAGIIGEVGTQGDPLTPNEIKVIKASGRASRLTGAPVSVHTSAQLHEQPKILDLLAAEGADLTRVIVGHSNSLAADQPFMKQLLDRGVYIQFDLLGRQPTVRRRVTDTDVAAAIVELIDAGYVDRILLSQDVCTKVQLKAFGGTGFSFILEQFIPYLKRLGVTDEQIGTIMITNPKRVLTFASPGSATTD